MDALGGEAVAPELAAAEVALQTQAGRRKGSGEGERGRQQLAGERNSGRGRARAGRERLRGCAAVRREPTTPPATHLVPHRLGGVDRRPVVIRVDLRLRLDRVDGAVHLLTLIVFELRHLPPVHLVHVLVAREQLSRAYARVHRQRAEALLLQEAEGVLRAPFAEVVQDGHELLVRLPEHLGQPDVVQFARPPRGRLEGETPVQEDVRRLVALRALLDRRQLEEVPAEHQLDSAEGLRPVRVEHLPHLADLPLERLEQLRGHLADTRRGERRTGCEDRFTTKAGAWLRAAGTRSDCNNDAHTMEISSMMSTSSSIQRLLLRSPRIFMKSFSELGMPQPACAGGREGSEAQACRCWRQVKNTKSRRGKWRGDGGQTEAGGGRAPRCAGLCR